MFISGPITGDNEIITETELQNVEVEMVQGVGDRVARVQRGWDDILIEVELPELEVQRHVVSLSRLGPPLPPQEITVRALRHGMAMLTSGLGAILYGALREVYNQ